MLQDKLNNFVQFNNPKRIADLRRYCATSITQTTKTISEGMTSRLLQSGSNSGGHSKNMTTARHCKSVSDLDKNSLITIDENNVKMTMRGLKDLQGNTEQHETTKDERQSFTFQLESKQQIRNNNVFLHTEDDEAIKDLENLIYQPSGHLEDTKPQHSDLKKKEWSQANQKDKPFIAITDNS